MKLFIVRHGETVENVNGIRQGQIDGTLSENGLDQIKKLAFRLKDFHFDAVFSSDQGRAKLTCEGILKFHDNEIFFDKRLRERYLASLQGRPKTYNILDPDVESDDSLIKRARSFVEFLRRDYLDKNVLIVSHGGLMMALVVALLDLDPEKFDPVERFKNASVSVYCDGMFQLFNDIKHLG